MTTLNEIKSIKEQKNLKKLTTLELSNLSGVPVGTLNKILSFKTLSVKYETLQKLKQALGMLEDNVKIIFPIKDNFGYVKVGACTPSVRVADVDYNVNQIKKGIDQAFIKKVKVLVFPELSLTAYTCGDLFYQDTLLNSAINGLYEIVDYSYGKDMLIFVGMPIMNNGLLYNVAVCVFNGKILGFNPKNNVSNYNGYYQKRYFNEYNGNGEIYLNGEVYPFTNKLLYTCTNIANLTVGVEISDDMFSNVSLSSIHAENGATICVNLSASNETAFKSNLTKKTIEDNSYRNLLGYVYANAGVGESTTDMVFAGRNFIAENGKTLKESGLFSEGLIVSDIDCDYLTFERSKRLNFSRQGKCDYKRIHFTFSDVGSLLDRQYSKTPFIPSSNEEINEKCDVILNLQAQALAKRLAHINAKTLVLGISGGLDSTLAILVAVRAMKILNRDTKDVLAVTLPCFGTTSRTKNNAETLCNCLNVSFREVNIKEAVKIHFKDIGHDETVLDVTYENSQARERTQVLMDIANETGGIVLGTGDLSELALGWATYNGDHMSMYGVNASIPKTLIRYIVDYEANRSGKLLKETLKDVLDTPVSPELIPANGEDIAQKTEDIVGPYLLHDFYLYYAIKMGFKPSKIYYVAKNTFSGIFDNQTLYKWLRNFYWRFFNQQFKRSCLPDGVKVDEVSLSPRGEFVMPSDAIKNEWLNDLEKAKDF